MTGSAELLALLERPVLEVAPLLLGAVLTHEEVAVRLTEVEAYDGADDPGSHAHRGRTPRNAVMFGPPGHLYVYFTYGMHFCANLVCGPEGRASAVLLRAGEIVDGIELARQRRRGAPDRDLARGPARLCRALGVDRSLDGASVTRPPVALDLAARPAPTGSIRTGPRVGLRLAPERPWRFWLADEPTVSAYRPAAPRPTRRQVDEPGGTG
ncbi:MAG: DNA-3-methyladenine glycosylase [Nocardioidaceae bacterium]